MGLLWSKPSKAGYSYKVLKQITPSNATTTIFRFFFIFSQPTASEPEAKKIRLNKYLNRIFAHAKGVYFLKNFFWKMSQDYFVSLCKKLQGSTFKTEDFFQKDRMTT